MALILPAVTTFLVLLSRICRPLLPYRPRWTKTFVRELNQQDEDILLEHKQYNNRSTIALLFLLPVGLALQIPTVIYPEFNYEYLPLPIVWVRLSFPDQDEYLCFLGYSCASMHSRSS